MTTTEPGATTPQRHRVPTWLIGVGLFAVFIAVAAIVTHGGAPTTPAAPATHTVVYNITSSGPTTADLTYKTPTGIQQQQGIAVPSTGITLPGVSSGEFLSISAQLNDDADITCTITVDGTVIASNTSSGDFAIASCDGRA